MKMEEREEIRIYLEKESFSNNQSLKESFIGEPKNNKIYLHQIAYSIIL
jgi:hypothetical protein